MGIYAHFRLKRCFKLLPCQFVLSSNIFQTLSTFFAISQQILVPQRSTLRAQGLPWCVMPNVFPPICADFLQHYRHDAPFRWSAEDFAAQQEFVNRHLAGTAWLDWSTESAALDLLQATLALTVLTTAGEGEAILLAGPVVELLDPAQVLGCAAKHLNPAGRLVGIIPCLRDNSPESQLFSQLATTTLWPYYTAEELLEMLRETGFQPQAGSCAFADIPRFNEAVLEDRLAFKSFRQIFVQLETEGYDPMEVGWGELRFVAQLE